MEISKDVKDLQPLNIKAISSTFDVSKFNKSIEVNLKQLKNKERIFSTFDVLKFEIFNDSKELQP